MRLEKGHLIVGHDTDALTNPMEADVEWAVAQEKPFFVGGRGLQILRQQPLGRKLVGLRFAEGHQGPWPEECHLLFVDRQVVGRITSISARSTVDYGIAMGFVTPELASPGTRVEVQVSDGTRAAMEVVKLPFYDPDNERQELE